MPKSFSCPSGTKKAFRYKKISGGKQRIGGCAKKNKFVKIKEIKTIKKGKSTYSYPKCQKQHYKKKY